MEADRLRPGLDDFLLGESDARREFLRAGEAPPGAAIEARRLGLGATLAMVGWGVLVEAGGGESGRE